MCGHEDLSQAPVGPELRLPCSIVGTSCVWLYLEPGQVVCLATHTSGLLFGVISPRLQQRTEMHTQTPPPSPVQSRTDRPGVRVGEQTLQQACSWSPRSARCVQSFNDSLDSAIRITYRISLRSSSLREPRYPLLKVVMSILGFLCYIY